MIEEESTIVSGSRGHKISTWVATTVLNPAQATKFIFRILACRQLTVTVLTTHSQTRKTHLQSAIVICIE
jgi:hypothetical protein